MQRDIELIRNLLLIIESNKEMDRRSEFRFDWDGFSVGRSSEEVAYHLALLHDANLVTGNAEIPSVTGLTNNGHDFLASVKNDPVWEATKARLAGYSEAPLRTYADIADAELRKRIGM